eukprot:gene16479-biopygen8255
MDGILQQVRGWDPPAAGAWMGTACSRCVDEIRLQQVRGWDPTAAVARTSRCVDGILLQQVRGWDHPAAGAWMGSSCSRCVDGILLQQVRGWDPPAAGAWMGNLGIGTHHLKQSRRPAGIALRSTAPAPPAAPPSLQREEAHTRRALTPVVGGRVGVGRFGGGRGSLSACGARPNCTLPIRETTGTDG